MFEGQALTLMDGDGPCQTQWQLVETALYMGLYLSRFGVNLILRILPYQRFYVDGFGITGTQYLYMTGVDLYHSTYTSIIITVIAGRIVLHKHHLRTFLQFQFHTCGIGVLRKITLDTGFESETSTGKFR